MENLKRSVTLTRSRKVLCVTLLIRNSIAALGKIGSSRTISQAGSGSPKENGLGGVDLSGVLGATPLSSPSCGPCRMPVVLGPELGQREPACIATRLVSNQCVGDAAALGYIEQRNTEPACGYTAERRVHR